MLSFWRRGMHSRLMPVHWHACAHLCMYGIRRVRRAVRGVAFCGDVNAPKSV
jgi:hypothetical protein